MEQFADRVNLPVDHVMDAFLMQALEAIGDDATVVWPIRFEVSVCFR